MLPLIEAGEVSAAVERGTVVIDARSGADSYERYLAGHLPHARYADLDKHLAAHTDDPSQGGRHPLPDVAAFADVLGSWGITPDTPIIIYDDKSGANPAARLWWMLRAIGHQQVQVINGGLQAIKEANIALSTDASPAPEAVVYPVPEYYAGTVTLEEVQQAATRPDHMVIDVRETLRYLGHTEPLDLIAGHIPGAVNLPYINNLDANGKYLSASELQAIYKEQVGQVLPENIIVHCGSGVTACHTLLGMAQAGITAPKLYVGSWSEWSRRDLPIGTEANPQG